jgi:hypothetical protein
MRPIDAENLRRVDEAGAISDEQVAGPDEYLVAFSAEDLQFLRTELSLAVTGIGSQRHRMKALNKNPQSGVRPGFFDELDARQRGIEFFLADLPQQSQDS